jgi:hypothetical protein
VAQQTTGTVTQAIGKFVWSLHDSLQREQIIFGVFGSLFGFVFFFGNSFKNKRSLSAVHMKQFKKHQMESHENPNFSTLLNFIFFFLYGSTTLL